ncbi:MAG: hypothetical protein LUG94_00350 [Ruminococcus sp.]|nr:hypothetical protein [Ruminococcus sp.]
MKKLLATLIAISTLATLTVSPISSSAIIIGSSSSTTNYYEENSVSEAILILEDAGDKSGTYYWINSLEVNTSSISLDSFTDDEINRLNKGFPVKIDESVDVSAVEDVITFSKEDETASCSEMLLIKLISTDCSYYYYTYMYYNYDGGLEGDGAWVILESEIAKSEIDSEDSITEFTVGDSVYPRGDINLDGKTNTADLLYLKKYLLGLIEW